MIPAGLCSEGGRMYPPDRGGAAEDDVIGNWVFAVRIRSFNIHQGGRMQFCQSIRLANDNSSTAKVSRARRSGAIRIEREMHR